MVKSIGEASNGSERGSDLTKVESSVLLTDKDVSDMHVKDVRQEV